ncbi:MAG: hypothetical protein V1824_04435 [archaeon]
MSGFSLSFFRREKSGKLKKVSLVPKLSKKKTKEISKKTVSLVLKLIYQYLEDEDKESFKTKLKEFIRQTIEETKEVFKTIEVIANYLEEQKPENILKKKNSVAKSNEIYFYEKNKIKKLNLPKNLLVEIYRGLEAEEKNIIGNLIYKRFIGLEMFAIADKQTKELMIKRIGDDNYVKYLLTLDTEEFNNLFRSEIDEISSLLPSFREITNLNLRAIDENKLKYYTSYGISIAYLYNRLMN